VNLTIKSCVAELSIGATGAMGAIGATGKTGATGLATSFSTAWTSASSFLSVDDFI
jgi:hypothetical protein